MKRFKFVLFALAFLGIFSSSFSEDKKIDSLYKEMNLENVVNYDVFKSALEGFYKIKDRKKEIVTIIDFTKPSTKERFYVLDLKEKHMLYKSVVSHGKNSGGNMATSFSNQNGSNKSSLGFFLTENTYFGKNGYSLRLDGLEEGINDKAKERAIVVHGANYANPSAISGLGRLGRSLGCPALPTNISKEVINVIKDGSVMYIHGNDNQYLAKSHLI
ncbi:MAG: murein L,D-transpeptidase catalytic domain family protein [Cetobacterium sp.]|uniref:murein L,D-transpeptidase catalytic domain family protein n=1 Tax=unclassified Cetobacterium TaxID=2630983 RepID=UPI00163B683F|nr:murein L,D-transpeptidase catalytic domain family protein [Cetobacterium sp. 2A]MBC2856784.1 murein L,D-transpeptidase catalytic domain family protein [Cetobacterium sp. 2A]